jgi:hypothetical protein
MECSDINDAFVNKKASNSALDMNFEIVDSMNGMLTKEVAYGALLLILIETVTENVSKVVLFRRSMIII